MASSSSCAIESDDAQLKALFDTFRSVCSLKDIALAYSKAGHNVERAGEILCNYSKNQTQGSFHDYNCEGSFKHLEESSRKGNTSNSRLLGDISGGRRPKKLSASVGSVSSFIGKTYFRPTSSLNEPSRTTKPMIFSVVESSVAESANEKLGSESVDEKLLFDRSTELISINNKDVEEFIFSMLGDGFKLSMDCIQEVLGNCGYNVKQSMEELFSLSAKTLGIDKAVDINSHRISRLNEETASYEVENKNLPPQGYSKETSFLNEEKINLSRQVLESLFSAPDIFEEEPKVKRLEWGLNRTRVRGQKPVTKPFDDYASSPTLETELAKNEIRRDEEDYQMLRKAAKQHWDTMKLYYEAAVDSFTKGNKAQASYCLEQGKHYYQLAREADEKSSRLILEKAEQEEKGNELPLDLRAHSVNESIRLLKLHLLSLASIPSFSHLKVTVNTESDNTSRGKRRREKVLQLLEKESIRWSEAEGSPGIILIPLNGMDHKQLSFETAYS
ncbi:putative nuclear RNA export factor SDE5 isoform X2 [Phalaenopsis equestris]|uniref:putative nuclear RNA export factor SDE5 isoform X2 n=1 Tax=Phalaenopsis equestris TaxID=78828 RepID=UPI0009E5F509|nr:putative nuclear RNA export factor SDE5 isoform X2 [Phalaenopsis equestris]